MAVPELKTRREAGPGFGQRARLAVIATIDTTIVVVVVLPVMLLGVDAMALDILGIMQVGALLSRHDTVGLGTSFHVGDVLLAAPQAVCLIPGQATRGDALIDSALLVHLALIDPWRICLGKSQAGQDGGKGYKGVTGFHDFLRCVYVNGVSALHPLSGEKSADQMQGFVSLCFKIRPPRDRFRASGCDFAGEKIKPVGEHAADAASQKLACLLRPVDGVAEDGNALPLSLAQGGIAKLRGIAMQRKRL